MLKVLHCRACDAALSRPVSIVTEDHLSASKPGDWKDEMPPVEPGHAIRLDHALQGTFVDGVAVYPKVVTFVLNLDDTVGLSNTPNYGRLNGCCGLDGCDGKNQVCVCGEHVGTRYTDCWQPRMFTADLESAIWKDAP